MAENIIQGLFGLSPLQAQQQQQAGIDAQANAYARQDPFERATAGMYRAGAGIAGIGAGMMGMVNPQVEEAKRRESVMGTGGDLSTSAGLKAKAQEFAQAGDQKTAMQLLMVARQKEAEEQDLATKRSVELMNLHKARTEASPFAKVDPQHFTPESMALFEQSGKRSDLRVADKPVAATSLVDKPSRRDFTDASWAQFAASGYKDDSVLRAVPKVGQNINVGVNLPKQGGGIIGVVAAFDKAIEAPKSTFESAKLAKKLINEASGSNNSAAWESTRTVFARMVGEGKLSNEDIRRTGIDPRLVQGALDWINKKVEGVPNQEIMKQLYAASSIIEKNSETQINQVSARMRNIAKAEKFEGNLDDFFPLAGKQASDGQWKVVK